MAKSACAALPRRRAFPLSLRATPRHARHRAGWGLPPSGNAEGGCSILGTAPPCVPRVSLWAWTRLPVGPRHGQGQGRRGAPEPLFARNASLLLLPDVCQCGHMCSRCPLPPLAPTPLWARRVGQGRGVPYRAAGRRRCGRRVVVVGARAALTATLFAATLARLGTAARRGGDRRGRGPELAGVLVFILGFGRVPPQSGRRCRRPASAS